MDTSLGPWKKIDDGSPVRVNAMPDLRFRREASRWCFRH